jgi:hypothetical protein
MRIMMWHMKIKHTFVFCLLIALLASACESVPPNTATPTWALSGIPIAPSATVNAALPTPIPGDNYFDGYRIQATAAALAPGEALPPQELSTPSVDRPFQEVVLTGADGVMLFGDLYQVVGQRVPGVLLLARNRLDWGEFPLQLYQQGFTVLSVDVEPSADIRTFDILLQSLSNGIADPSRLAVLGGNEAADLALIGCANTQLCKAVGLLSPRSRDTLLNMMLTYNPRPLLLVASREDVEGYATAEALQAAAQGDVLFQPFENAGNGAAMLQQRADLSGLVVAWLQQLFPSGG